MTRPSPGALPRLLDRAAVQSRLVEIFPEGIPNRQYRTRDIAAATVFTMIYIGAVDGTDRYLGPKHVYRMTDRQAHKVSDAERLAYGTASLRPGFRAPGKRWYADNTREPIRDETLRDGLIPTGAVLARPDVPTTSSRPRYALSAHFAALFDPTLTGATLAAAIERWQNDHLSRGALARIRLLMQGVAPTTEGVLVTFPNGQTRRMVGGPSSVIAKAVIEDFAPRFLNQPGVILLSESKNKFVAADDALAGSVGLRIDPAKSLPDVILVDLGLQHPLLVFVEIVATDGAVTETRQQALQALAREAGFGPDAVAFVTAYRDRSRGEFRKTVPALAWHSFAWFASEPDHIIVMRDGARHPARLSDLLT
jgi:hypothetical protein